MKLARDKVIAKLKSRIAEMEKQEKANDAARDGKHRAAVRAFTRIHITTDSTYDQINRAANLLSEVRRYAPDNGYSGRTSHVQKQIEREIALLEMSSDDTVSVRTNSSLADFLT